jgi:hypothetical protein
LRRSEAQLLVNGSDGRPPGRSGPKSIGPTASVAGLHQLPPEREQPQAGRPAAVPRTEAARPAELIAFDALQKRVGLRNIAIIRPTERNIRNYLAVSRGDRQSVGVRRWAITVIWAT